MPGFRRAQLRGSDELFRTTDETQGAEQAAMPEVQPVHPVPAAPSPGRRSIRLTEDEIEVLVEALQHLKFPGKAPHRPSIGDFERLEELRQRLLQAI